MPPVASGGAAPPSGGPQFAKTLNGRRTMRLPFSADRVGPPYPNIYSVLSATTGSFLAAMRDGTKPAISVRTMLPAISAAA